MFQICLILWWVKRNDHDLFKPLFSARARIWQDCWLVWLWNKERIESERQKKTSSLVSSELKSLWFGPECNCNITKNDYISEVQPTICNVSLFIYFYKTLYMFQAVPPPIIRNKKLYMQSQVLSTNTAASCCRRWDGTSFYLVPSHPR